MSQKSQMSYQQLSLLLERVETELKAVGMWSETKPASKSFQSELPFFYDTMSFEEWVQWVYIARFREMIKANQLLPQSSDVSPMAEESFQGRSQRCEGVIAALRDFDRALGQK